MFGDRQASDVFLRGLGDLDRYLEAKGQELRTVRESLQAGQDGLNHRQVSVFEWLSSDLNSLTGLGFLVRLKIQRVYVWRVSPSLAAQLVD